ncbi:MAG: hypothetical protein AB7S75_18880 [Desulfococcaceae bacterium]
MDIHSIKQRYEKIWKSFADELCSFYTEIGKYNSDGNNSLHEIIKSLHWVPYEAAHEIVKIPSVESSSGNIGSITGMFFEQVVCSIIVPYIEHSVPAVKIERNCCSDSKVREISRDPDLFIQNGERSAVFEIKVVLTKPGIEKAKKLRENYRQKGVPYFLIGGKISAQRSEFEYLANKENRWASFTYSKNENGLQNLPKIDEILKIAVDYLNGTTTSAI